MGLASAAAVRDRLIAAGRDPRDPGRGAGARDAARIRRRPSAASTSFPRSRPKSGRGRPFSSSATWSRARRPGVPPQSSAIDCAGGRMTSPLQQKLKITGPVVVTANRLGDGAVVYRSADGGWTTELAIGRGRHDRAGRERTAHRGARRQARAVDALCRAGRVDAGAAACCPAICASGSASTDRPSRCRPRREV